MRTLGWFSFIRDLGSMVIFGGIRRNEVLNFRGLFYIYLFVGRRCFGRVVKGFCI